MSKPLTDDEITTFNALIKEYRLSMDKFIVHAWAHDVVQALKSTLNRIGALK